MMLCQRSQTEAIICIKLINIEPLLAGRWMEEEGLRWKTRNWYRIYSFLSCTIFIVLRLLNNRMPRNIFIFFFILNF